MDIQVIPCKSEDSPRTLKEFQTECLELFLEKMIISIEIDPTKLIDVSDKLQHLALKELEKNGILKSYEGQTGTVSYFLVKECWDVNRNFNLNLSLLNDFSKIYNNIMPAFMVDQSFFKKIGPLEVDNAIIESVISLLRAMHVQEDEEDSFLENEGENTYSVE